MVPNIHNYFNFLLIISLNEAANEKRYYIFSWRERTAEVEFLREVDGKVFPVEVKSGRNTQAKSLKVFAEKYNPKFRSIMSSRNLNIDHDNSVHHYPLYMAAHFPLFV